MKLHVLSDLHLEFAYFSPPETDADVIVLAGDIGVGVRGIEWAANTFRDRPVVYVPGNHEYYGSHLSRIAIAMRSVAKDCGVHLLDNDAVVIDGVRFLGTTLWTDFQLFGKDEASINEALRAAKNYISDFSVINYGSTGRFLPEQSVVLHFTALSWLQTQLKAPFDGSTVVVSHHCPHWNSVHERFRKGVTSAAFASDLDRFMGDPIDLWIHGHTHDSFDYDVRGTQVVCNPRGYSRGAGNENGHFKPDLLVEVGQGLVPTGKPHEDRRLR
jgi:Icc-related predicted phosphoesterase